MQTSKQFTRNAEGFYLQVELHPQAINFILASNNQDEFYQLRLTEVPSAIRKILPTLSHFFFYLQKNFNHPRAFKIDPFAKLYVTVPGQTGHAVQVILPANRITRDSIMPEDFMMQEEPAEVQEVKATQKSQNDPQPFNPYFGKKKKRDSETCCLDLEEETPRSDTSSLPVAVSAPEKESDRNKRICHQTEQLLAQGLQMRQIKQRLRLSDQTAWKMYQQFQKYKRIFTPEETTLLRRSKQAKQLLQKLREQNPNASIQFLRELLEKRGLPLTKDYIQKWLKENLSNLIYYQESQSVVSSRMSE